jgi:hypothetical protein
MRKRTPPRTGTPRIFDAPEAVRRADRTERRRHGVATYDKPFELASVLRAYGVRVLSSLGPQAELALRELADHRDPRVRQAVVEELVRHRDVAAVVTIANLAIYDEVPVVRDAARDALVELRRVAERLAAEQSAAQVPLAETGEEYHPAERVGETSPEQPVETALQGSTPESSEPSASS